MRHAQRSIQHRRQTTESRTIGATPIERDIPLPVVRQTAFPNARRIVPSPVGELGASSERLTAGGLHEGYVWVVAEAAEA